MRARLFAVVLGCFLIIGALMQPFLFSLLALIAVSVGIGAVAQIQKGRTGAGWATLTFAIGVALWLFYALTITIPEGGVQALAEWEILKREKWWAYLVAGGFFAGVPGAFMALVVWSLPKR